MTVENQKICQFCGKDFVSPFTDEQAREELETEFPGARLEDCVIVCSECFDHIRGVTRVT